MRKKVLITLLLTIPLYGKKIDTIAKEQQLSIENATGHRIFINKQKLDPQEAVVLYWDEPLHLKEQIIEIYYGGNKPDKELKMVTKKKNKRFNSRNSKRKSSSTHHSTLKGKPALIAQLRTNQPGTVILSYDAHGILKMERI